MALDPVTAIANAISGITGVAQPFIDESIAEKYENEYKSNLSQWNQTFAAGNADAINSLCLQFVGQGGQACGGVGTVIGIQVDIINSLVAICIGKIKDDEIIANIQFKQNETNSNSS